MMRVLQFFEERDPFVAGPNLKNIANGVVADSAANPHEAKQVGEAILQKMKDQKAAEFSFKRTDQAVTMILKNAMKFDGDTVSVDPQLLFQRLVSAAGNVYEDKEEVFRYELSSYPASLFESTIFLRQGNKAALAEELWIKTSKNTTPVVPDEGVRFILDGGALLQKLPWQRGSTYASIVNSYVRHVMQKFDRPVIVFDGYISGPSTKDITHLRRCKGKSPTDVHITPEMVLHTKRDAFLANPKNKQRFIDLLSSELHKKVHGCLL